MPSAPLTRAQWLAIAAAEEGDSIADALAATFVDVPALLATLEAYREALEKALEALADVVTVPPLTHRQYGAREVMRARVVIGDTRALLDAAAGEE